MTISLVLLLLFLCVIVMIRYLLRRRYEFNQNDILEIIKFWIMHSYHGGWLFMKPLSFKHYSLRLSKYILSPATYGMILHFPANKHQDVFFEPFREFCVKKKLKFSITEMLGRDIIVVDFGKDIETATSVIKYIYFTFFEMKEDALFCFSFTNTSFGDKEITDPALTAESMTSWEALKAFGFISKKRLQKSNHDAGERSKL